MTHRPLTDYLNNILNEKNNPSDTPLNLSDTIITVESMEENARDFASALNLLLGRVAINEHDITLIVEKAKKDAGML